MVCKEDVQRGNILPGKLKEVILKLSIQIKEKRNRILTGEKLIILIQNIFESKIAQDFRKEYSSNFILKKSQFFKDQLFRVDYFYNNKCVTQSVPIMESGNNIKEQLSSTRKISTTSSRFTTIYSRGCGFESL